ncbi:MAG TPA: trehalase calcium-binding domain-containing protein, partial [Acidobacteriota bacterium]|nr:trehalase calcium-binding domain-containing protein [Acidobacteriota bacterium]
MKKHWPARRPALQIMGVLFILFPTLLYPLTITDVQKTFDQLLTDEDTDNDKKITIDDPHIIGTQRGDKRFWIESPNT